MAGAGTKLLLAVGAGLFIASQTGHSHHHHAGLIPASVTAVPDGGSIAANITLGQQMAAADGFTGPQWGCLYTLWQGESGWSQYADTRKTGLDPADAAVYAYGIPQARPAQKMAAAGPDWQVNPATQIRWGLGYIRAVYRTPCSALAFKRASGNQGY